MAIATLRTFSDHEVRLLESLDGRWQFITAEQRNDKGGLPQAYDHSIQVPSCWQLLPGLETYRGRAWYRTTFEVEIPGPVRLVFGGVAHHAEVYVDGDLLGSHYDAYTPFALVAAHLEEGEHELVLSVDNSFGPASALHIPNDYYSYGGITRPTAVEFIDHTFIEQLHATPKRSRGQWTLDVQVRVRNCSQEALTRQVLVAMEGVVVDLGTVSIVAESSVELSGSITKLPVQEWTAEQPNLYAVAAFVRDGEDVVDDLIDRVGFREVRVRGKRLLLNGAPLRLRGFNRHESHACFGSALPLQAMAQDLEIIRSSGANFVRTSHYPNDQRFLDLCDELGIYVWEESHARNIPFDAPAYAEQMATNTEEMVDWHFNHPSIIMWGCLNECDSESAEGAKEHERMLRILRQRDGSRPVTFASNKHDNDVALHLVDIVSWNLYPGWYGGGPENVEPTLKRLLAWLHHKDGRSGARGKPVILSEFGGGAFYGCRQREAGKWSEDYQAQLIDECLRVYLNHPDLVGAAIWQFCDCRVDAEWGLHRPRAHNNKGMVDEYRRPKLAWDVVCDHFQGAAEVPSGRA